MKIKTIKVQRLHLINKQDLNILTDNVTQFASFLKIKDSRLFSFDTMFVLHDYYNKKNNKKNYFIWIVKI